MTIWTTITDFFAEHGITSVAGEATRVVGFYNIMVLMVMGLLLGAAGLFARQGKYQPSWLMPAAVGATGIELIVWSIIPGFPLMSLLGLVLGIIGVFVAYLLHTNRMQGMKNANVTLGLGIGQVVFAIFALVSEITYGGGFLG